MGWQGKNASSETIDGTALGETWPDTWEVAAHIEGCTDDRGAAHTDDFWGRGKCKNVDENTDAQDPSHSHCPNCNRLCKSQRGISIHLARSKCKPVSKHIGRKSRRDVVSTVVRRKTKQNASKLPEVDAQGADLETAAVFRPLPGTRPPPRPAPAARETGSVVGGPSG